MCTRLQPYVCQVRPRGVRRHLRRLWQWAARWRHCPSLNSPALSSPAEAELLRGAPPGQLGQVSAFSRDLGGEELTLTRTLTLTLTPTLALSLSLTLALALRRSCRTTTRGAACTCATWHVEPNPSPHPHPQPNPSP